MTPQGEFAVFCQSQHPRLVGALTLFTGDADLAHCQAPREMSTTRGRYDSMGEDDAS